MKKCRDCRHKFPATADYFHEKKDGRKRFHSRCKACRNAYGRRMREIYKARCVQPMRAADVLLNAMRHVAISVR
jgi:hypothetical protein